jgi:hypothetical protein
MFRKYYGILVKRLFFILVFCLLFSCVNNEIDKLLNEVHIFISKNNPDQLFEQLTSNDDTFENEEAMAEFTRFIIVMKELENQWINMTDVQKSKYFLLKDGGYIGKPKYSYFNDIGIITARTKDSLINYSVTVEMRIAYDLYDFTANKELTSRINELRDFICHYFSEKTVDELETKNEDIIRKELREMLNTKFLETTKIRIIYFSKLDVLEKK